MRILIAIPHYYHADDARHGSGRADPRPRISALSACLDSLGQHFSQPQCLIDIARRTTLEANHDDTAQIDIVVCTTHGRHLLDHLPSRPRGVIHSPNNVEPKLLGFECHAVLRGRLAQSYDVFGYMEDDLIIKDPWFFRKQRWFTSTFGDDALLQPHRYETGDHAFVRKAYIDGPIRPEASAPYQNVDDQPTLSAEVLGVSVSFARPTNPHAGCFFLNREQMETWAKQPWFLDRDTSFIGPLESAATLGIMRTFRVYKPAASSASFHEIQHAGSAFLQLIKAAPSPAPKA